MSPKRRALLERSWAGVFRKYLLEALPVQELAEGLDAGFGRPSKDLHVALGALILQQMFDLTDKAAIEALAFNLAWHYALDIRSERDCYFCEKTLRSYRARVVRDGLDEVLFRHLTDKLIAAFDVGIIRRYVDREGDGCFARTTPGISRRRLSETGPDLLGLVVQFRDTAAAQLPEFAILEEVLKDQFDLSERGDEGNAQIAVPRPPADIPCDTVGNPADPDAS